MEKMYNLLLSMKKKWYIIAVLDFYITKFEGKTYCVLPPAKVL